MKLDTKLVKNKYFNNYYSTSQINFSKSIIDGVSGYRAIPQSSKIELTKKLREVTFKTIRDIKYTLEKFQDRPEFLIEKIYE